MRSPLQLDDLARFNKPRRLPWQRQVGLGPLIAQWQQDPRVWDHMVLATQLKAEPGAYEPLPADLALSIRSALTRRGIHELFSHQAQAWRAVRSGHDVVVATPTASGKSLCYNLPLLDLLSRDASACALYLFPTKALSRDQEEGLRVLIADAELAHPTVTYDGDTPSDARRAARERASVVITNPDMLHSAILPHHASWARLFASLKLVVIDELHTYRGVLGSHLANVLRRLQRVAVFHGSHPRFVLASATIGNPAEHAARLVGRPARLIAQSGAPAGERRLCVYNPPVVNAALGIRASYVKAAVRLTADLIGAQVPTILFGPSRNTVEIMLTYLREEAIKRGLAPEMVQGYRGGYLPSVRRNIERGLREGHVRAVVATSALELGIDIGTLDAAVCAGYPGSIAALWQRFGRAGRRGELSLALLVASSSPLDQFFALEPKSLTGAPVEQARIDPDNGEILVQHIKCAAFELPFTHGEGLADLPAAKVGDVLEHLCAHELLHAERYDGGATYHWSAETYPANHVSLRSIGWDNVVVIDREHEHTIGELDWRSSHTMLHEQAIYQQEGEQYQVERLDLANRKAYVRKVVPDYFTTAMTHTKVSVISSAATTPLFFAGGEALSCGHGEVSVVEKVVGFKKIKFHSHENVGWGEVALPEMQMHTTAYWLTVPESVVRALPYARPLLLDAIRGLGEAMHTVAAAGLMIDPHDLGRALADAAQGLALPFGDGVGFDPTLFLFDQVPGGVGLAPRLFDEREQLLASAHTLIAACTCAAGCPVCIGPGGAAGDDPRKPIVLDLLRFLAVPRWS